MFDLAVRGLHRRRHGIYLERWQYAFKWIVGNADSSADSATSAVISVPVYNAVDDTYTDVQDSAVAVSEKKSVVFAYRGDWYINDTSYIGLSGLHGRTNRVFDIMALDGGITRGDWQINGQLTIGRMDRASANGSGTSWQGLSGLLGYKVVPRLQLLARADYLMNSENGGGTYPTFSLDASPASGTGLGPVRDADGKFEYDPATGLGTKGANLMRLTFGTNYQVNSTTQWKTEYRLDQSSGYNFVNSSGTYSKDKQSMATSLVLSF